MNSMLVTIAETSDFLAAARKLMTAAERTGLIDHLAGNPLAGDLIPGTGGIRKLRWALEGRGKRGGARVVYYFHNEHIPLLLLDAYAKNEKADLKPDEIIRLRRLVKAIKDAVAKEGTP
jgi:hypothetical protein